MIYTTSTHIESLNDQIEQITGVKVRETVPDGVVNDADGLVAADDPARYETGHEERFISGKKADRRWKTLRKPT